MSNSPAFSDAGCIATSKCDPRPISQGFGKSDDNPRKRDARNTDIPVSDWRAQAEARGRAAYEAAAEPQTTAEPLAWLWGAGGNRRGSRKNKTGVEQRNQ
jgi:hypothetical protein